jgi:hypothetical protein
MGKQSSTSQIEPSQHDDQLKRSPQHPLEESGDYVYDYFTFNMDELVNGDYPMMPLVNDKKGGPQDSDHDSSDSNRES